ncbi:MAG: VPLPA-CTERM sorting domain-containing protein, partial [Oceanicola sp.]|nr:VPLPA-CTERM sorting domain-containing protein [Oceanicola sp.]
LISTGARAGEGWAIADADKARAFTDALFGTNPCSNATGFANCGSGLATDFAGKLLGENYTTTSNLAWFLNGPAEASGNSVGYIYTYLGDFTFFETVSVSTSDLFSASGTYSTTPVSWLLYRDAPAPVPVPASLPLLAVGLGGLGYLARRRRKLR